jgi:TRAP-type C4-dicarboxylate transport system permease small subunit
MSHQRAALVLRLDAVVAVAVGALLVLGTWDGLYESLDLPQALPALPAQIGGVVLLAFAFLLWRAAQAPGELRLAVAQAGAASKAAAVLIIAAWLIFRDRDDLQIGTQGIVELIIAAVVLIAFAVAEAAIMRRRPTGTTTTP